jgi:hypothetical protein
MTPSIDDLLSTVRDVTKQFALGDGCCAVRARSEMETDTDA